MPYRLFFRNSKPFRGLAEGEGGTRHLSLPPGR